MDLYFSPLACSLGARIALYEAGAEAGYYHVDAATKTTQGHDYREINPKGLVPAIRTVDGDVLSENAAVLQYIADCFPKARLAPAAGPERYRLQQWLSFVGSELHKAVFAPLLGRNSNDGARDYARSLAPERFDYLDAHLAGRDWLLGSFSVADAYLAAVLNWAPYVKIDLGRWPAVAAYRDRLAARPSVARAVAEEMDLFRQAA
ncbi:glutathione binding-like protein [Sphingosinicella sp. BN140058]|uniref:glutathione binding-like protein n=1 Tax=Sphingosinicella sp. BN140058 TaxID=1892855 RepID=UPI001010886C|nr:glutathione binding-like protein [Sphingosinicella sp. BN140058]QAY77806.1 glutathione S-transferase [Sphingosinicella sp. BN140058]